MKHFYTSALFISVLSLNAWAAWDGSAVQWTAGTGTEEDPYLIENEQHLAYLQQTVADNETYEGMFFRLTADIDMDGKVLNPIGFHDDYVLDNGWVRDSKVFLGAFDGAYHTIDNVIIELAVEDTDEIGGVGLFAVGRNQTAVRNLKLGNRVVVNSSTYMSGGVMGISYGSTIENCSFAGTINGGPGETGGILGRAESGSTIKACVNSGTVIGNTSTGGIVGSSENAVIADCLHVGTVNGNDGYMVAGIIGWALNSKLTSSVSVGSVEGITGFAFLPGKSPVCSELEQSEAADCYYVESETGCGPLSPQVGITALSETEMKSAETLASLNGGEDSGAWSAVEGAYPTLTWTLDHTAGVKPVVVASDVEVCACGSVIVITAKDATYSVVDLSGRVIAEDRVEGSVSLSPVSGAVYVVAVKNADGAIFVSKISL